MTEATATRTKADIIKAPQVGDRLVSRKTLGGVAGRSNVLIITAIGPTGAVHSELHTTWVDAYGVTHTDKPTVMPMHRAHTWRNNGDCILYGFDVES